MGAQRSKLSHNLAMTYLTDKIDGSDEYPALPTTPGRTINSWRRSDFGYHPYPKLLIHFRV